MRHVKLIGWASMLFLLFLTSCREENIDPKTTINLPEPVVLVSSTVTGQVIDENNDPVSDVSMKIGDEEVLTDENGFFEFSNMNMNKNGTHITANKFGYFFNSKMVNPALGNKSFVLFQMLDKVNIGSFNTADGGELSTADGASVTFGANAIMYENGAPYTGMVEVSAKWLDPTHAQIADRMPGDLRAIDTEEALVQLATYGMLVVELEAPNGSALQLSEGTTATISLPVPEAILSVAPGTIPLWSFDETTGYWVEESSATLQGNKYVGDVSHFSFWNCDAPFPVIEMEGSVVDTDGNPVQNIRVAIGNDNVGVRFGWTDSDGKIYGKLPKDEALTIAVVDQCNNEIYTDNIGPFSAAVVLDPITIPNLVEASFNGTLLKCDGSPVTNGYAFVQGDIYDRFLETDENGNFNQSMIFCDQSDINLRGFDLDIPLTSEPVTVSIPAAGGNVDLGDITVCDVITEIIHIEIPDLGYSNDLFLYNASDGTSSGEGISISAEGDSLYMYMQIDLASMATGTADMFTFNFQDYENPATQGLFLYCQGATGGQDVCPTNDVTANEGPGGLLTGSFTGEVAAEQQGGGTYEITVEYNVILQ